MQERLLTQGRGLSDYMQSLLLPKMSDLGLYHDAYPKSTSMFAPMTTLFAWLGLSAVVFMAFIVRNKYKQD